MANEYLKRTPTSTGNRKVWTWSGWLKRSNLTSQTSTLFSAATSGSDQARIGMRSAADGAGFYFDDYSSGATQLAIDTSSGMKLRDFSSWMNLIVAVDTTKTTEDNRVKLYINGVLYTGPLTSEVYTGGINYNTRFNQTILHTIGWLTAGGSGYEFLGELADIFFIDGQALTPDVFGFYKEGKGYISAGSTQATDFRPGQWVPKTPRVIKSEIERNGGFGVNGFYLPMNDSSNFGADFHCEPNSIITLKGEDLPQPRNGAPTTTDAYVSQLRADPYAANLVLAVPGISGGQGSGYGDYSADIKGSGSNKTVTANGNAGVAVTASYYGSSLSFDGTGDYFTIPYTSELWFGSENWTLETWVNPSTFSSYGVIWDFGYGVPNNIRSIVVYINITDGVVRIAQSPDGTTNYDVSTGAALVLNQWNHLAIVRNGSVITIYLNGVATGVITAYNLYNSTTRSHYIGIQGDIDIPFNGYLQDLRIYKGVAKYKGGFDVPKPYTPVGISTWRAVPDCTANNFATWNPLDRARNTGTQTDGNLATGTNSGNYAIRSTVGVSTGKWYWEFLTTAVSNTNHHGIVAVGRSMGTFYLGQTLDSWGMYDGDGNKRNNGSYESYGTGFSQYDVGMVALDRTNGKIWWGKNGTWFASGDPSAGSNAGFSNINSVCGVGSTDIFVSPSQLQYTSCSYNFGQNPTFSGYVTSGTFTDSNGKGLFKYQPPSGFLALCEDNLPTPEISDPGDYFKTVLYTGNGSSGRSITGIGFTPDLVWTKGRTVTTENAIYDSVRGGTRYLSANGTGAEQTVQGVISFNNDGFSAGTDSETNGNGINYTAWCWRAGAGTTSTNTDGSIQSVVSVNQTAGFSVVSYNGNLTGSGTATVGHGLGKNPAMIITKARNTTSDWIVMHKSLPTWSHQVYLHLTDASVNSSSTGTRTVSTSTFTTNYVTGINVNGNSYVAYCWAEIEGFSKAFSYVGNGSADGPMVYLGLKPALIIIKRTNDIGNWQIYDSSRMSTNPNTGVLFPNLSNIEGVGSGYDIDFLSNGFKLRSTDSDRNASGSTYVGFAWAESPFQTSNSK